MFVKTPNGPVGENPPAYPAIRHRFRSGQVPQNLSVGRAALHFIGLVPVVERKTETLAFLDQQSIRVSVLRRAPGASPLFVRAIGKERVVGYVFVPRHPLLRQVIGPSKQVECRAHQVQLGQ